jgi:hypothetical protein
MSWCCAAGRTATLLAATTQLYDAAVSWVESAAPSLGPYTASRLQSGAYLESSVTRQLYGLVDESAKLLELAGALLAVAALRDLRLCTS